MTPQINFKNPEARDWARKQWMFTHKGAEEYTKCAGALAAPTRVKENSLAGAWFKVKATNILVFNRHKEKESGQITFAEALETFDPQAYRKVMQIVPFEDHEDYLSSLVALRDNGW